MSQFDFGNIDPFVVDGIQLADFLNQWRDALHSMHRGAVRPAYAVPGMLWIDDAGGAANWIVNVYLSPTIGDKPLFTYNTLTGDITNSALPAVAAILLAQAAALPSVRWANTGNGANQKNWRATVTATGALRFGVYDDANVETAWIEFQRDGEMTSSWLVNPVMKMAGDTILAVAANEIRVAVPVAAKVVELSFMVSNVGNVDDVLALQALNGAVPFAGNNHNTQFLFGSGAAAAASFVGPSTSWQLGNGIAAAAGRFQPQWAAPISNQTLGTAKLWAQTSVGTKYSLSLAMDGGPAVQPTGYRLFTVGGTNMLVGSFLRALACYN